MKVIGFVSSPRKDGNTAFMVGKILEGARERGAETRSYHLNDLSIKPCQSCYGCKDGDLKCRLKDDMQTLYEEIEKADALVLGSPVYMWQMSAQAKTFTDRLFARFNPRTQEENAKKKMVLAFTHDNPDSGMFQSYFHYTENMFRFLGFKVGGVFAAGGTRVNPLAARTHEHAGMKAIGYSLVQ